MDSSININIPEFGARKSGAHGHGPLEVLDAVADKLAKQTKDMVKGSVYIATYLGSVRYTFNLVMPKLNDYTDPLFFAIPEQGSITGYPTSIIESGNPTGIKCDNEEDLTRKIEELFSSTSARSRIEQWLDIVEERGNRGVQSR